jgi:hypothetical protein
VRLDIENLGPMRKACVLFGILLLLVSMLLAASTFLGVTSLETFAFLGHSGIRTLAGSAVAGCMLAAIGYFDE